MANPQEAQLEAKPSPEHDSRGQRFPWACTRAVLLACTLQACIRDAGEESNGPVDCVCTPAPFQGDPRWMERARVGNADLDPAMSASEVNAVLDARLAERVSVLEVDVGLSQYLTDEQFLPVAEFLTCAACLAHNKGLRAVVYYPSLESLTENGLDAPSTMYKDHPDWVQRGMDGKPNVFYGSEEFWVESRDESAWLSPNGPYRQVYLDRIRALAGTGLDGIWVDVPLFMDTGAAWTGVEPASAAAFQAWSKAQGLSGGSGYDVPSRPDWDLPAFRAWLRWRHENLAEFLKDVHDAAQAVAPGIRIVVENFPMDYLDATDKGLDGAFVPAAEALSRVWEVDSVSNTQGMMWATPEDFASKIAMFKWARAADRGRPSWVFSYGNEARDAGLVMAAALATGNAPFEVKTPEMFHSVGPEFRKTWFGFMADHPDLLPGGERLSRVGVWYSSASRDYLDYRPGAGHYGMYVSTDPPTNDPDWWATEDGDSCIEKPHLGGWRGAANALTQLRIAYEPILSPGEPSRRLANVGFLWLPSVKAMSDADVQDVRSFVETGGFLLATGEYPAATDDLGNVVDHNRFEGVLGTIPGDLSRGLVQRVGQGITLYRPHDLARSAFEEFSDSDAAAEALSEIERLVRIHVEDDMVLDRPRWVHVEAARPSDDHMVLYTVHFGGLKRPIAEDVQETEFVVRVPAGRKVSVVEALSPDEKATRGPLVATEVGEGLYRFAASVDLFTVFDLRLEPAAVVQQEPYPGPTFQDADRQAAALDGLQFVLKRMRDPTLPEPWRYGVWTNLLATQDPTDVYAYGHLMTSEHMGLMLQAAACLGDAEAYGEALSFVRDLMVSPLYRVVNWAMDPDARRPVVQQDTTGDPWRNGNAPLDDFRVVTGLMAGAAQVGSSDSADLARRVLRGLYWTSVTDRDRDPYMDFPKYPGGLIAYAWNWEEANDETLTPPARATGAGETDVQFVPLSYQDLETIALAARFDPRWRGVLASATDLVLAAEVSIGGSPSGLFWNGLDGATGAFIGDFEYPDARQGKNLKVIQVLWTALHLAAVARMKPDALDAATVAAAGAAAGRSLAFFKTFYAAENRIPEYLTPGGRDVPACVDGLPDGCLIPETENLTGGEARIYALAARLALAMGDRDFASDLIERHILTDRVTDPLDPRHGQIGVSTANDNDAEAWNVLESVLTLCIEAGGR